MEFIYQLICTKEIPPDNYNLNNGITLTQSHVYIAIPSTTNNTKKILLEFINIKLHQTTTHCARIILVANSNFSKTCLQREKEQANVYTRMVDATQTLYSRARDPNRYIARIASHAREGKLKPAQSASASTFYRLKSMKSFKVSYIYITYTCI